MEITNLEYSLLLLIGFLLYIVVSNIRSKNKLKLTLLNQIHSELVKLDTYTEEEFKKRHITKDGLCGSVAAFKNVYENVFKESVFKE